MMGFSFFDSFMSNAFPVIFMLMFIAVFGTIIFTIFKGIGQWNKNNNSPVLTVDATVVAKRTDVSHRSHNTNDDNHYSSSTWYYTTFEVESGDRMELGVDGEEFGMLVEGDKGKLTFQGTRYKGFERK